MASLAANTSHEMTQGSATMANDSLYEPNSIDEHDITMETSMMQHRTAHSRLPNYMVSTQAIKPSVSFRSLGRDQARTDHFVDLDDGPSPLQKRHNVPTLRELGQKSAFMYEKERQQHTSKAESSIRQLSEVRKALYEATEKQASTLSSPKTKREELAKIKSQMTSYNDFKDTQKFLGKRERLMSKGWRHGIVGVDDADTDTTQVFYQTARDTKIETQKEKDVIN